MALTELGNACHVGMYPLIRIQFQSLRTQRYSDFPEYGELPFTVPNVKVSYDKKLRQMDNDYK